MTVSATSTPLDFTDVTDTSSTELPTSVITISPKKVNDTCDKLECKRLAGRMLAQMGHEFNPCDNFYMYACGGIHSDPFLQPYDYTVDMMDRIRHGMERESHSQPAFLKFASFYSSCMEANDVEFQLARELIKILKDIGDFLDPASGKAVDFTHFFAEIISLHRPLLFDIIVDVDDSNSDRYMLKMTTPIHENPFRFGSQIPAECNQGPDIKNNSNFNDVYEDIKTCEVDLKITSLGNGISEIFAALNRTDNYTIHLHHYDAVLSSAEWMSIFYKMEPSESERRHSVITKNYTLVTVSDLNKNYPVINWTVLLEKLLGKSVPDNTSVQLYSAEYFNQLFDNFQEGNFVKIYNSLLAAFVQQLREDLVLNMSPVEGYCLTVAAKLMEDVAAGAYLNSFNRTELDLKRRSVETIFKQLRDTFKQLLHSSDWLVSDRDALLKKLDSMTLAADGGVNIFTMDKLNNQMSSVNISKEPDSYVRNSIALLRRYRSNIYKSLDGKPRDLANVWSHFSLPQEAYGISIYGINTVAMPYAMLAWPFFHNNYPEYLQIAGLGHIIAHEMSHHFDNVGMKYNPKGELEMMLHGPAQELYSNMETCFAEQFNTPESQQSEDGKTFTFTLNPELHREEQLADDIATLLLYSLFKNRSYDLYAEQLPFLEMNNDQVFFLHLAQSFCTKDTLQSGIVSLFENEHLPSLLRVNHFLSQSKDFSEVFNCPADSKMNPTHRCEVFPALNRTPA
ncbi:endothelin-converting enzyme 1 [Anabrus simplex]|uniref:endothelin-converting enzyme 1 n=1 Tax=Anabrus simplex TaxID=316456 RepID=UPI0035A2C900